MVKCVMIQLCKCLAGVSILALHVRFCYLLLGWIGTLVVVGVQLAIAGWMVWAMIRAPDWKIHSYLPPSVHFKVIP